MSSNRFFFLFPSSKAQSDPDRDRLVIGANLDVVTGAGDDRIVGLFGDNEIDAGDGRNRVLTGFGDDIVATGDGRDTIRTGWGDDTVNAGGGRNQVSLGAGNDTAIHIVSDGGTSRIDGGRGFDTLQIVLTADEAQDLNIVTELERLFADLAEGRVRRFDSEALGLRLRNFESLEILAPVVARDDDFSDADEDTSVFLDVLSNDLDLLENLGFPDSPSNAGLTITEISNVGLVDSTGEAVVLDDLNLIDRLRIVEEQGIQGVRFFPVGLFDFLAADQLVDLYFDYTVADDQGFADTAKAVITVQGINDAPILSAEPRHEIEETTDASNITKAISASFEDVDVLDANHSAWAELASIDGTIGSLTKAGLSDLELLQPVLVTTASNITGGTVEFLFSASSTVFDFLTEEQSITLTYRLSVVDDFGATGSAEIDIVISGTNDGPIISGALDNTLDPLIEDDDQSATGTLVATGIDPQAALTWSIESASVGTFGSLSLVGNSGTWVYTLANGVDGSSSPVQNLAAGQIATDSFVIRVADDKGGFDDKTLTLTIEGKNDGPAVRERLEFETLPETGFAQIEMSDFFSDLDLGDTLSFEATSAQGQDLPGFFTLDPTTGLIELQPDLADDGTYQVLITAKDRSGATAEQSLSFSVLDKRIGSAIDGYIAGATVFADADGDGELDEDEARAFTDANGEFALVGGSGDLVLVGGTDISTGLPFKGTLRAPEGSTVLTPLTTLIVAFAEQAVGDLIDFDQAEEQVKAVLDLPAEIDLTTVDPVKLAVAGDPDGARVLASQIQVQNTVLQAAAIVDGSASEALDENISVEAAFEGLAATLASSSEASLLDTNTIGLLLNKTQLAASAKSDIVVANVDQAVLESAANLISTSNVSIENIDTDAVAQNPVGVISEITQVAIVSQSQSTAAIEQSAELGVPAPELTSLSTNFEAQVTAAADQLGDIDGTANDPDSEFDVSQFNGFQVTADVLSLSNGNIAYAYRSFDGGSNEEFGTVLSVFDPQGNRISAEFNLKQAFQDVLRNTIFDPSRGLPSIVQPDETVLVNTSDGGFVAVFTYTWPFSTRVGGVTQPNRENGIVATKFDSNGVLLNEPTIVYKSLEGQKFFIEELQAVDFGEPFTSSVIAWRERASGLGNEENNKVLALRIGQDGEALVDPELVGPQVISSVAPGNVFLGSLVAESGVRFSVYWGRQTGVGEVDQFRTTVDALGVTTTRPNNPFSGPGALSFLLENKNTIGIDTIEPREFSRDTIYQGRLFDSNGNIIRDNIPLTNDDGVRVSSISFDSLPGGGFVIAWLESDENQAILGSYARMFDSNGDAISPEIPIVIGSAGYGGAVPLIAGLENGGFSVFYDALVDDSTVDARAQIFDAQGRPILVDTLGSTFDQASLLASIESGTADGSIIVSVGAVSTLGAAVSILPDGSIDYNPENALELKNFSRTARVEDEITLVVQDASGIQSNVVAKILVNGTNIAPVSLYGRPAEGLTELSPSFTIDLLEFVSDFDGDVLEIRSFDVSANVTRSNPRSEVEFTDNENGTITIDPQQFDYLAENNFAGISIKYIASDGVEQTSNEIFFSVRGLNNTPVLEPLSITLSEDDVSNPIDLQDFTVDPDIDTGIGDTGNQELSYSLLTVPNDGLVDLSGSVLTFDPLDDFQDLAEGQSRDVLVTLGVTDASGTTNSDVTFSVVGVNDAPTISVAEIEAFVEAGDASAQALESSGVVSFGDVDDGDLVDISIQSFSDVVWSGGELDDAFTGSIISGFGIGDPDAVLGTIPWVFNAPDLDLDFLGEGERISWVVTLEATDNAGGRATADLELEILGTNDAPELSAAVVSVLDRSLLNFDLTASGFDPDFSENGSSLSYQIVSPPTVGSAEIVDGVLRYEPGDSLRSLANGDVQELPVTIRAVDASGAAALAEFTIRVIGTNDTPVVSNIELGFASESVGSITINLLENVFDFEDDPLEIINLSARDSEFQSVVLADNNDGTVSIDLGQFNRLDLGETLTVTLNYSVFDGNTLSRAGIVTFEVTGVDSAPVVSDIEITGLSEDALPFSVDLLIGATDPESEPVSVVGVSAVDNLNNSVPLIDNGDGTFAIDPFLFWFLDDGDSRIVTITYDVTDGDLVTPNIATVEILGASEPGSPPSFTSIDAGVVSEDTPTGIIDLLLGVSDPDGDPLSVRDIELVDDIGNPVAFTDNGDGTITVDPTQYNDLPLEASVTLTANYVLTDGNSYLPNSATLLVQGVNDLPVVSFINAGSVSEDDAAVQISLLQGTSDVDGDALTVENISVIDTNNNDAPVAFVDNGDGSISIDPNQFNGLQVGEQAILTVDYDVDDGIGSVPNTAALIVDGANDAPLTSDIVLADISENAPVQTLNLLSGASDPDGDDLSVQSIEARDNQNRVVTLTDNGDGTVLFDPSQYEFLIGGQEREITINYAVSDGRDTTTNFATITVLGNRPPEVIPTEYGPVFDVFDQAPIDYDLINNAFDLDGDALAIQEITVTDQDGNSILFTDNGDGTITIDPSQFDSLTTDDLLEVAINYEVTDGFIAVGNTDTFDVIGFNDAPRTESVVLNAISEDAAPLTINLLQNAIDPEGDQLSIPFINAFEKTTFNSVDFTDNLDGTVSLDPTQFNYLSDDQNLTVEFQYNVVDGTGNFSSTDIQVTVLGNSDLGTPGDDTLVGGANSDNLEGLDGNDDLFGLNGNDFLFGDAGDDRLFGGDGDDTLDGGEGNDELTTGAGNNLVVASGGIDTVDISTSTSTRFEYTGAPIALSFAIGPTTGFVNKFEFGTDTISGLDTLNASSRLIFDLGDGGDSFVVDLAQPVAVEVNGDLGSDVLTTGSGNDILTGGAGADDLDGGLGVDIAVFSGSRSDYAITQTSDGYIVEDLRTGSPDGIDTVTNIETFRFIDGDFEASDFNDTPVGPIDDLDSAGETVVENAGGDTLVGITPEAIDPDAGDTVSYELSDDRFEIDTQGRIVVRDGAVIDFEAGSTIELTVTATSSGGGAPSVRTFNIDVTDVNDVVPAISSGGTATAAEDIADTAIIYQTTVTDADTVGTFTYRLTNDLSGLFRIDASGAVRLIEGLSLDFEAAAEHTFTVVANDGERDSAPQMVTLTVTDVNDVVPAISSGGTATAAEDIADTAIIYQTTVTDADTVGTFTYRLTNDLSGLFRIDASGAVRLIEGLSLDFEAAAEHTFTVVANDGERDSAPQMVTLTVTDVNDVVPAISSGGTATAAEDIADTAIIYQTTVTDADTVGTFTYRLTNDLSGLFRIDASGAVRLIEGLSLDFEAAAEHTFTVVANDGERDSAPQMVTLTVTDVNESVGPVSDVNSASDTIVENADGGTVVGITALASDPDAGDSVSYSVTDPAGEPSRFAVDSNGVVTVVEGATFDASGEPTILLTITATSTGGGAPSTAVFPITVTAFNDTPVGPVVDLDSAGETVVENAGGDTLVGITPEAIDPDAGDTVSYELSDDRFEIDTQGRIVVRDGAVIDFEAGSTIELTVTATSSGGGAPSVRTFNIDVTDVNDVVPAISSGGTATAAEDIADTAIIYQTTVTDADTVGTFTYRLTNDLSGLFRIDASGAVRLIEGLSLDFEAAAEHTFTVVANDGERDSAPQMVTLTVTDVNDVVPAISSGGTATAAEDIADTAIIYQTTVSDADTVGTFTYRLTNDLSGLFRIDASGAVRLIEGLSLDFEAAAEHTFTVVANDGERDSAPQMVTLTVTDVNDVVPAISSGGTATAAEDIADTAIIYQTTVTDADTVGTFTYRLTNDLSGLFRIDATGAVRLIEGLSLDFETTDEHTFTVVANDGERDSAPQMVTLTVTDVEPENPVVGPVVTAGQSFTNEENSAEGTVIGTVQLDSGSATSFAIDSASDPSGSFAIDTAGVITLTADGAAATSAANDFELGDNSFDLIVTASDGVNTSAPQTVTVDVTNVDDNDIFLGTPDPDVYDGGIGNDIIFGQDDGDTLSGNIGDDQITGNIGNDFIDGGEGNDVLEGGGNVPLPVEGGPFPTGVDDDIIVVGSGFNTVIASPGDDTIRVAGSEGTLFDFSTDPAEGTEGAFEVDLDVQINGDTGLITKTVTGFGLIGTDTIAEIDSLGESILSFQLGLLNDRLVLDTTNLDVDVVVEGGTGDDELEVAAGTEGVLIASYRGFDPEAPASSAITYTGATGAGAGPRVTGQVTGTGIGTDTLTNVAAIIGTNQTDTFTGGDGKEIFVPLGGDDTVIGGLKSDTVVYSFDEVRGVTVNLNDAAGSATGQIVTDVDEFGTETLSLFTHTLIGIEVVEGSSSSDDITLGGGTKTVIGSAGNDTIDVTGTTGITESIFDYSATPSDVSIQVDITDAVGGTSIINKGATEFDTVENVDTLDEQTDRLVFKLGDGADSTVFRFDSAIAVEIDAGLGNDEVEGSNGNDIIAVGGGINRVFVSNGSDTIDVTGSAETVFDYTTDVDDPNPFAVNLVVGTDVNGDLTVEKNIIGALDNPIGEDIIKGIDPTTALSFELGSLADTFVFTTEDPPVALAVDGGAGDDTVVFAGNRSDYLISEDNGIITVTDTRVVGPDGEDTFVNVETFSFDDAVVSTSNLDDTPVGPVVDLDSAGETVLENAVAGTLVGITPEAVDPDAGDTVSYELSDNRFEIDAQGRIVVRDGAVIDFEAGSTIELTVTATSSGGGAPSVRTFNIDVTDVNDVVPAISSGGTATAAEDIADTAIIYQTTVTDADTVGTFTYRLTNDLSGLFRIDASGAVRLIEGLSLDFEAAAEHTFTVVANDGERDSAPQMVTLTVTDVNESVGPVSDVNSASDTIVENADGGTVVGITALASDPDAGDSVSYSVTDPAGEPSRFAVDSNGVVTVVEGATFDASGEPTILLTITATSTGGGAPSTAVFPITVTAFNDTPVGPVVDLDSAGETVVENAGGDTLVGITPEAIDPDAGDTVSYELSDDRFEIDTQGRIVVRDGAVIDFEAGSTIELTVTATSSGGGAPSVRTFNIDVTDVNDVVPAISSGGTATAAEDIADTAIIYQTTVSDADTVGTFTYRLTNDLSGLFRIDASGAVRLIEGLSLDFEAAAEHTFTVVANDGERDSAPQMVTLTVTDVNDVVPAISSGGTATAAEDIADTAIIYQTTVTDADTVGTFTYRLTNDLSGLFRIDASGAVRLIEGLSLDFETAAEHTFTVVANDGERDSAPQMVTLTVTDVNDVVPAISSGGTATAAEDIADTAIIYQTTVTDADTVGTFTYRLTNDLSGLFRIDASGAVRLIEGLSLDFEAAAEHTFTVVANDGERDSAPQMVTLTVTDVNDVVPAISSGGTATAAEDIADTAIIYQTTVTDADTVGTFTYRLTNDLSGLFRIDATGAVRLIEGLSLDFEAAAEHTFTVVANDGERDSAPQMVTLTVTDVNDVVPAISSGGTATAAEDIADTAIIYQTTVTDADTVGTFTYRLTNDLSGLFRIDASGAVRLIEGLSLDFEAAAEHTFTVVANDGERDSAPQMVTLTVTDVNDVVPAISSGGTATAAEDIADTAIIYQTTVTDADTVGTFTYRLTNDLSGLFRIDASGAVRLIEGLSLDFEAAAEHTFTVVANDGERDSAPQMVTLTVTDVNDVVPAISSGGTATAAEDIADTAIIYQTTVSDADTVGTFTYRLTNDLSGLFRIDASGAVRLIEGLSLDFEAAAEHTFTVVANDGERDSAPQMVTLTVTDVNDVVPAISSGGTATAAEDIADTAIIYQTTVTDADTVGTFTYRLTNDLSGLFRIDATGAVRLIEGLSLDFETTDEHTFTVVANDGERDSAPQMVTLTVTDVEPENPVVGPVVTAGQSFTNEENSAEGTVIGTVQLDSGSATSFAIDSASDPSGSFAIDTAGVITLTADGAAATSAANDFELGDNSFDLIVTASDGVNTSAPQTVTVDVTNVDDNDIFLGTPDPDVYDGGIGNDIIFGQDDGDTLSGNIGDDQITGNIGNDFIDGGEGNDVLEGGGNVPLPVEGGPFPTGVDDDIIVVGSGFNTVIASPGDDTIRVAGSEGTLFDFSTDPAEGTEGAFEVDLDVQINGDTGLITKTVTGFGLIGTDTIAEIDSLGESILSFQLGLLNDRLVLDTTNLDVDVVVEGGTGDDELEVAAGTEGVLIASYRGFDPEAPASSAITYTGATGAGAGPRVTGQVTGTGIGTDTLTNVAAIIGTNQTDTFTGGDGKEIFVPLGGDDTVIGGLKSDTVVYSFDEVRGVTVNLNDAAGSATGQIVTDVDEFGTETLSLFTHTLIGIEVVEGSSSSDDITLGGGTKTVIGSAGNDTIDVTGTTGITESIFDYSATPSDVSIQVDITDAVGGTSIINKGATEFDTVENVDTLDEQTDRLVFKLGDGADSTVFRFDSAIAVEIDAGLGNDEVEGSNGNDIIAVGGGINRVFVSNGSDTIDVTGSAETVFDYTTDVDDPNPFAVNLVVGTDVNGDLTVEKNIIGALDNPIGEDIIKGIDPTTALSFELGSLADTFVFTTEDPAIGVTVEGGAGNDNITGGAGVDIAVFSGNRADYLISEDNGIITVTDTRVVGSDGEDTFVNVETFRFNDVDVSAVDIFSGVAIDGYIAGATVFADADGDGILDAGEASDITNATGQFTLVDGSGDLALFGGTDVSTGLAFQGFLTAPEGSSVITPLTTLVVVWAQQQAVTLPPTAADFAQAQTDVKTVLQLPTELDLTQVDPVALAASGDERGFDLLAAQLVIQNTVVQAAATVIGASNSALDETSAILAAYEGLVQTLGDTGASLDTASTISAVIQNTAVAAAPDTGGTAVVVNASVLSVATELVAQGNAEILATVYDGANPTAALTAVTQVAIVAQGEAAQELLASADTGAPTQALTDLNTNFAAAIDEALSSVGDIDGTSQDNAVGAETADSLVGGDGNNTLIGLGGNDRLEGGAGDDFIDGGDGDEDTVVFSGRFRDYLFTPSGSSITVVDDRPGSPDGTDTVQNVENWRFSNGVLETAGVLGTGISLAQDGDADRNVFINDPNSSSFLVGVSAQATDSSGGSVTYSTLTPGFTVDANTGALSITPNAISNSQNIGVFDVTIDAVSSNGSKSSTFFSISQLFTLEDGPSGDAWEIYPGLDAASSLQGVDVLSSFDVVQPGGSPVTQTEGASFFAVWSSGGAIAGLANFLGASEQQLLEETPLVFDVVTRDPNTGRYETEKAFRLSEREFNAQFDFGNNIPSDTYINPIFPNGPDFPVYEDRREALISGSAAKRTFENVEAGDVLQLDYYFLTSDINVGDTAYIAANNTLLGVITTQDEELTIQGSGDSAIGYTGWIQDRQVLITDAMLGGLSGDLELKFAVVNVADDNAPSALFVDDLYITDRTSINGSDDVDDTYVGFATDETVFGGGGADTIDGGGGNDALYGGADNDTLTGGLGSDLIVGGTGDDILVGGVDIDTFLFIEGDGVDVINDFEVGTDVIDLADFRFNGVDDFEQTIVPGQNGDDNLIDLGNGQTITVKGVGLLQADDFNFV